MKFTMPLAAASCALLMSGAALAADATSQQQAQKDPGTEVLVDQGAADVQVQQPSPDVKVVDPEPTVKVQTPEPEVSVDMPKPEVEIDQAQPNVSVSEAGKADVTIVERDTAAATAAGSSQSRQVSEDQYKSFGDQFAQIDEDGSGSVDETEFQVWYGNTFGEANEEETAALFGEWDDDEDAALTEDEWADDEEFAEWDENDSGILEEDEGWF